MVLALYGVMRKIDPHLSARRRESRREAASPPFRHVFLPLSLPGVVNGCVLVFTICLGFYITPILLGTPRDMMISQLINQQIEDLLAWGFASAIAVVLLAADAGSARRLQPFRRPRPAVGIAMAHAPHSTNPGHHRGDLSGRADGDHRARCRSRPRSRSSFRRRATGWAITCAISTATLGLAPPPIRSSSPLAPWCSTHDRWRCRPRSATCATGSAARAREPRGDAAADRTRGASARSAITDF